jgi:hypothetical protein
MKNIKNILLTLAVLLLSASCQQEEDLQTAVLQSAAGATASGPYLTKDNLGNTVLCWAEKNDKDSLYRLKYAVFNPENGQFGATVTVDGTAGMNSPSESMGKIAFKSDNTVFAVFSRTFPNEKNPFAGGIYYTSSADQGKSWMQPLFLHSDTSHSYGRAFFDITATADGEIAAIWLDGRFGKSLKGSALFYAKTGKNQRFGPDTCIHKGTCECCRTDLLEDDAGNLHIAYRSIIFPDELLGQQARDMVYSYSTDRGVSFSDPKVISKDNWAIDGCPHTGPSLAILNQRVHAVWFTAGGNSGIYHTVAERGSSFANRSLLSAAGRHPQMIATNQNKLFVVFEEGKAEHQQHQGGHAGMPVGQQAPEATKIVMQKLDSSGKREQTINITEGKHADHHAVISQVGSKVLVAWLRDTDQGSRLYYMLRSFK